MKHCGTQTIETKRLILRQFTMDDAEAMYTNWASDPAVTKYLTWQCHETLETTKAVIQEWTAQYDRKDYYQWAIEYKDIHEPVGSISVVHIYNDVACVEAGYCIGKKWWHKGITSEALNAIIHFLFQEVEVNRIEAIHDIHNPYSGKVMQKCGMRYEGTMRQYARNNTGICDVCMYAILKEDIH